MYNKHNLFIKEVTSIGKSKTWNEGWDVFVRGSIAEVEAVNQENISVNV